LFPKTDSKKLALRRKLDQLSTKFFQIKNKKVTPTKYPIICPVSLWPSLDQTSMNLHHCTHYSQAIALSLGADSLYTEKRSVENLGLSAIMIFTWFFVTHVSILTSDISISFYNKTSVIYRTFCYLFNFVPLYSGTKLKIAASVNFLSSDTF